MIRTTTPVAPCILLYGNHDACSSLHSSLRPRASAPRDGTSKPRLMYRTRSYLFLRSYLHYGIGPKSCKVAGREQLTSTVRSFSLYSPARRIYFFLYPDLCNSPALSPRPPRAPECRTRVFLSDRSYTCDCSTISNSLRITNQNDTVTHEEGR